MPVGDDRGGPQRRRPDPEESAEDLPDVAPRNHEQRGEREESQHDDHLGGHEPFYQAIDRSPEDQGHKGQDEDEVAQHLDQARFRHVEAHPTGHPGAGQMAQHGGSQGHGRVGGHEGPDTGKLQDRVEGNPETAAGPGSAEPHVHGFSAVEGVAHHLQVVEQLHEDAQTAQPEERPTVLGRHRRTEEPLSGPDRHPHHDDPRTDERGDLAPSETGGWRKVPATPGRDAGVHGWIGLGGVVHMRCCGGKRNCSRL